MVFFIVLFLFLGIGIKMYNQYVDNYNRSLHTPEQKRKKNKNHQWRPWRRQWRTRNGWVQIGQNQYQRSNGDIWDNGTVKAKPKPKQPPPSKPPPPQKTQTTAEWFEKNKEKLVDFFICNVKKGSTQLLFPSKILPDDSDCWRELEEILVNENFADAAVVQSNGILLKFIN
jgi:signal recognition particle GTPase